MIKVAAWNVEGRLTAWTRKKRGTPKQILAMIRRLNADILVLPEAYLHMPADGIDASLREMGYAWRDVPYNDRGRKHEFKGVMPHLRVASKLPIIESDIHRWGGIRDMLVVTVKIESGKTMRVIATHLDDRAEKLRLAQLDELIPFINKSHTPTVMLGDFNAMHGRGRAKLLGHDALRLVLSALPHDTIRWTAVRLADMASGSVLRRLEHETNLRDIDPRARPTTTPKMRAHEWMPSVRLAQIDHILVSPGITVTNFKIARDGGADHRAISATISIS